MSEETKTAEPAPANGQLVPAVSPEPPAVYDPTQATKVCWTNLPKGDDAAAALLTEAMGSMVPGLETIVNTTIELYGVVTHSVELEIEATGELVKAVRTVLITTEGKLYKTVSQSGFDGICRILGMKGAGPWHPGLRLRVSQGKTRKGFNIYNLTLESPQGRRMPFEAQPGKPKGK